ncbi:MAG: haloacid dehalogenase-like hydrolase [Muribaculaceae bacterium]|nr:haloacid dehalogenase-like hydrolase [Muribaculaceae bacterium]
MVERLQEKLKGATFVDLDGTLLVSNSMHVFMRRLPGMLLKRRSPGAAVGSLWWILLRCLKVIDHRNMKWHLTKTARKILHESDWNSLAQRMLKSINPHVRDFVESRRDLGCKTFIATAAMEEYTLPLCNMLGYDGVIATEFSDEMGNYEEKKGYAKHDGIENLLSTEGLRLESFITDHPDDIPTASAYPGLTILVNPTRKTADQFREIGVTRYLRCE